MTPRTVGVLVLVTAGCVLSALFSFLVSPAAALVYGFAPPMAVLALWLGWRNPLAIAGLVLLLLPLQPLPTMAMQAAGLWYAKPFSAAKELGLIFAVVALLWRGERPRLLSSDWLLIALVAVAVGCRVFGGVTVGLKDDLEFGLAYAAGRVIQLSFDQQVAWVRRALIMMGALSVLALLEYWYGGIAVRMLLMHWMPADLPSQFTATGYSAYRVAATLNGPVEFGCLCAFMFILVAAYRDALSWKLHLLLVPIGAGLLLSVTRSAWAAALLGLAIVEWKRGKKVRVIGVLAGAALLFLAIAPLLGLGDYLHATRSGEDVSLQGHEESLRTYWNLALERPMGSGPGTVGPRALERSGTAINVESSYLTLGLQYGVLGGLLFVAFCLAAFYLCWTSGAALGGCAAGILGGYLLTMLVLPMHISFPIAAWAWLPVGMAVSARQSGENARSIFPLAHGSANA